MTNFSRIFPARNSKLYDKYFSGNKQLTKIMYKYLHTAEIVPYGIRANQPAPQPPRPIQAVSSSTGFTTGAAGGP